MVHIIWLGNAESAQLGFPLRNISSDGQAAVELFDTNKDFVSDFNFEREYKLQPKFAKNFPQPLLR